MMSFTLLVLIAASIFAALAGMLAYVALRQKPEMEETNDTM